MLIMDIKESLKEYGKHLLNIGVAIIVFAIPQPIIRGEFKTSIAMYFIFAYILVSVIGNIFIAIGGQKYE